MASQAAGKPRTAMDEIAQDGAFKRTEATFRDWIRADNTTPYAPEANRYHLYVSYACPWASRCLAVRALKGLDDVIGVTIVHPVMERTRPDDPEDKHTGWPIRPDPEFPECTADPINDAKTVRELYDIAGGAQKYSVPVLWDKKTGRIVSNESSEIIRMLNKEFNALAKNPSVDLYPDDLAKQIDEINDWVLKDINNGVYRSGFATKQAPYDTAVNDVFDGLDRAEEILSRKRYICGDTFTEADIRLFVSLVRFDEVYHGHFKCNKKRLADYPNLENYTREIYQMPGIKETVNMKHIKHHYHRSHPQINPYGIVPAGPGVDYSLPHNRGKASQ